MPHLFQRFSVLIHVILEWLETTSTFLHVRSSMQSHRKFPFLRPRSSKSEVLAPVRFATVALKTALDQRCRYRNKEPHAQKSLIYPTWEGNCCRPFHLHWIAQCKTDIQGQVRGKRHFTGNQPWYEMQTINIDCSILSKRLAIVGKQTQFNILLLALCGHANKVRRHNYY